MSTQRALSPRLTIVLVLLLLLLGVLIGAVQAMRVAPLGVTQTDNLPNPPLQTPRVGCGD